MSKESLDGLVKEGLITAAFAYSPYVQRKLLPLLQEQPMLLLQRGSMLAGYPTVEEAALLLHAIVTAYSPILIERHIIGASDAIASDAAFPAARSAAAGTAAAATCTIVYAHAETAGEDLGFALE